MAGLQLLLQLQHARTHARTHAPGEECDGRHLRVAVAVGEDELREEVAAPAISVRQL